MTRWLPTTPLVAMAAGLAWLPGVAPAPYEPPAVAACAPAHPTEDRGVAVDVGARSTGLRRLARRH